MRKRRATGDCGWRRAAIQDASVDPIGSSTVLVCPPALLRVPMQIRVVRPPRLRRTTDRP